MYDTAKMVSHAILGVPTRMLAYTRDSWGMGWDTQVGDRAGSGRDVTRACAGARAAITELLALTEDFKEEVGIEHAGLFLAKILRQLPLRKSFP